MFKKVLSSILVSILIMALALSVFTFTAGAESFSAADALKILRYSVGSYELTEEEAAKYDANGDGKIDTLDALAVLRLAVGTGAANPADALIGTWKISKIVYEGETYSFEEYVDMLMQEMMAALEEEYSAFFNEADAEEVEEYLKEIEEFLLNVLNNFTLEFKSGGVGEDIADGINVEGIVSGTFTYVYDGSGAVTLTYEDGTEIFLEFDESTGVLILYENENDNNYYYLTKV